MSLDQTNKDLNRDMQELKNKVSALEDEVSSQRWSLCFTELLTL